MQTASFYSVQRGKEKKTHLTYGKSFLMVLLSSQHALTTHYIPYMFYEMLLPSDGSLKTSLILFCFFPARVDFAVGSSQACVAQC